MPVIIASSVKEAKALINGGKYREIILNFDIDADDFFSLASHSAGTKISIADRNDRSPQSAKTVCRTFMVTPITFCAAFLQRR